MEDNTLARIFCAVGTLAIISGCATGPASPEVITSPAQTWRAKGADKLATISGKIFRTGNSHQLLVEIDGMSAVEGSLGIGDADISSQYQGKPTQALCTRKDNYKTGYVGYKPYTYLESYDVTCRIIIDSEFVATLRF